jgi:lysophospholipid acyltransferase (LPLAT)-like uncharacterized protein
VTRGARGRAALASVLGVYLDLALRTTRWRLDGAAHLAPLVSGTPMIVAFWHEHLPLMAPLWLRARRLGAPGPLSLLVSRHRDGQLLGATMRRFGTEVIHGSSSRGGAAGLRGCARAIGAGGLVALTPDGPRGPRRVAAPGVAQLAALTGAPVLPAAAWSSRQLRLRRTWDRMAVPLPLARGVLVCGPPVMVARDGWEAGLARITAELNAAAARAKALGGGVA